MATKKELQARYKELYGEQPDESVTVKELNALIKEREGEIKIDDEDNDTSDDVNKDSKKGLDFTNYDAQEGVSFQPDIKRGAPESVNDNKIWTRNIDEIESVENRRSHVKLKGGKATDVTEYYGVKK